MASNPAVLDLPENKERAELVLGLLDLICPFGDVSSSEPLYGLIAGERWEIVLRAGWDSTPIERLQELADPYL